MNKRFISLFYIGILWQLLVSCQVANQSIDSTSTDINANIDSTRVAANIDTVEEVIAVERKVYRGEETKLFRLLHTKLEVSFDWEKKYLHGTATIQLKPYFYPQSVLYLDAKGFDIHGVSLIDSSGKSPLEYTYDSLILSIELDQEYTRNEQFFVEIDYTAKPYELPQNGSEAITSDRGLYFINADGSDPDKPRQIWTQGETEASSCWFPTIDAPNQRTTQEMYITIEDNFSTLSNGVLVYSHLNEDGTRTDYWNMDKPHAPYLFMMAIGEYAIVREKWEDIEVSYYVEPEYEKYAKSIFGNTPEMLSFFSERLDYKYPWSKYAQVIVEDFVSGAMENTTASTFMEAVQVTDRELLDENWDNIIAHELFHHWFGDLVTCESWANLPLNEAFANYSEYLWVEHKYGVDEADYNGLEELTQYLNEASQKQVDLIRFYYDHREDMFDSHSYAKGGRILHMLRKYVGDDAFFAALSTYLKAHEYSDVEVHDLRLAFEEVTGEDMNWFFNQWFLASGHPILDVSKEYVNGLLKVEVTQMQDLDTTPLYQLPLYIDIYQGAEKERYAIMVDERVETFEFEVANAPDWVDFDPEKQLLGEIYYAKEIEELVFQYQHAEKFLARYEAVTSLAEHIQNDTVRRVIKMALNDSFWGIRQEAVNAFDAYKGADAESIMDTLAVISRNDEKSLVRADALAILASYSPDQYLSEYKRGFDDPSYAVIGAALYGYGQTAAADKSEVFEMHEGIQNINTLVPIADYYSLVGQSGKIAWFAQSIDHADGAELYYLLQYLGQYLMKMPEETQKEGFEILKAYARNHDAYYVRLAAFQGLLLIEELEGVRPFIELLKKEEDDERLKQFYERY